MRGADGQWPPLRDAAEICSASVGRHALMPPLVPGRLRGDQEIDPYKCTKPALPHIEAAPVVSGFAYFLAVRGRVMPLMLTLTLFTVRPVVDSTAAVTASCTALATSTTEWP